MQVLDLGGGTLDVAILYVPASNSKVTGVHNGSSAPASQAGIAWRTFEAGDVSELSALGPASLVMCTLRPTAEIMENAAEDDMCIKAVDADLTLGGNTFTSRLVQYCLDQLAATAGRS